MRAVAEPRRRRSERARSRGFSAVGVRFRVVGDVQVVAAADAVFADLADGDGVAGRGPGKVYRVGGGRVVVDGTAYPARSPGECLEVVQWHVNQRVVAAVTTRATGLHAAAAARAGVLVLLPGESGAGKSTTVAGLLRAGWDYLTDEAAFVDPATLHVLPYPKPVSIEPGARSLFAGVPAPVEPASTWLVPAAALGARPGAAAPPALVMAPRYTPGAATDVEPLTPGEVLMLLARCAFSFNEDGERHLRVLARVARRVPGFRLAVGDLDEAVATIGLLADGVARR